MKIKILLLTVFLLLLSGSTFVSCDSDDDVITRHATGTVIGNYSNGFGSVIIQVDEKCTIGEPITYGQNLGCLTLPENKTYTNAIQVQPFLEKSEVTNQKISFFYRRYNPKKDEDLFKVSNLSNAYCIPPDVPMYVIIDCQILN